MENNIYQYFKEVKIGMLDHHNRVIKHIYIRTDYYIIYEISCLAVEKNKNANTDKSKEKKGDVYDNKKNDKLETNEDFNNEKEQKFALLDESESIICSFYHPVDRESSDEKEKDYWKKYNCICNEFYATLGYLNDVSKQNLAAYKLRIAAALVSGMEFGFDMSYPVHQFRDLRKEMKENIKQQKINHIYYVLFVMLFCMGCIGSICFFTHYVFKDDSFIKAVTSIISATCLGSFVISLLKVSQKEILSGFTFEHLLVIAGARTIIAIICGVFIVFMTIFLVPLFKIDFGLGGLFVISGLLAGLCEYFLPSMLYRKPKYINNKNKQLASMNDN